MKSASPLAIAAIALSACLTPVTEAQCSSDADCMNGTVCIDFRCKPPGSGGGNAGTGGGDAGGNVTGGGDVGGGDVGGGGDAGGVAAGGGVVGGGGTAGGVVTGGGSAGGGTACGCRNAVGQCQVGDSPFACGTNGLQCQRCNTGEQCVNGGCVMAACGPGTCSGCCGRGICVTPSMQSTVACGASGAMCTQCQRGQDCVNGTCQTPPACGPMSCAGCCQQTAGAPRCVPLGSQSNFTCGSGGLTCSTCARGTNCSNGACVGGGTDGGMPGSCNPTNCATGCCAATPAGTFCVQPNQQGNFACGTGAMTCTQCMSGTSCTNGACLPNPVTDAGIFGLPNGSACTATSTCEGNCIQETQFGQPTGYPGGYCTASCAGGQSCSAGSVCVTDTLFGQTVSTCRGTCTGAGTGQGSCRTGYVCVLAPNPGALVGYCRPNCNNGGLAMCSTGACQADGTCM